MAFGWAAVLSCTDLSMRGAFASAQVAEDLPLAPHPTQSHPTPPHLTTLQLVVVETALNTAHGSAHGNEICRQDCLTFAHAAAPGSHEQVRCGAARGAGIGRA